jgi:eukaryotic-like serine/threonine-protein kinase
LNPDRYELLEVIGRGAGGTIHRAIDHDLKREVALKVLRRDRSTRAERVRFVAEAQVASQLEHPNIIPIHDVGKTDQGDLYFVMKRVRGNTLKDRLDRPRPELLRIIERAAEGVACAHRAGVIHRDLKPSNIMVGEHDEVLVIDWGLARGGDTARAEVTEPMSLDGDVMGSLGYMAPEQALGQVREQGPPTDVHALGAILYEVLTGKPPRNARTLIELLPLLRRLPIPPAGPLGVLALRCLASDPLARPSDAGEFLALLQRSV